MDSSPSFLDYLSFLLLRPILAISFAVCFIALWWFLAWKLVLSHVPLVQEIFGLKKKTFKPKPESRGRFSKYYKKIVNIDDYRTFHDPNRTARRYTMPQQSMKIQVKA